MFTKHVTLLNSNLLAVYNIKWYLQDERKAELELGLETCGADGGSSWATIGIIIGCVLAAIAIIAIVAVIVAKKKYRAVNTQDNP